MEREIEVIVEKEHKEKNLIKQNKQRWGKKKIIKKFKFFFFTIKNKEKFKQSTTTTMMIEK